jgi:hypothetical protein
VSSLQESAARFEAILVSDKSTPSQKEMSSERLIALGEALAASPNDQRTALALRYPAELFAAKVAARMSRSPVSVTGFLYCGTKALREQRGGPFGQEAAPRRPTTTQRPGEPNPCSTSWMPISRRWKQAPHRNSLDLLSVFGAVGSNASDLSIITSK